MTLTNFFRVGTLAHAGTAAVQALGAKTVAGLTGVSESMVYAMSSASDEARRWGTLPAEKFQALADELRRRQRPEFISLAFARVDDLELPAPTLPNPMQAIARLQVLRGRTCQALCGLYDRAGGRPVVLGAGERKTLIDALDLEIVEITRFRDSLLTSAALPALADWTGGGR